MLPTRCLPDLRLSVLKPFFSLFGIPWHMLYLSILDKHFHRYLSQLLIKIIFSVLHVFTLAFKPIYYIYVARTNFQREWICTFFLLHHMPFEIPMGVPHLQYPPFLTPPLHLSFQYLHDFSSFTTLKKHTHYFLTCILHVVSMQMVLCAQ